MNDQDATDVLAEIRVERALNEAAVVALSEAALTEARDRKLVQKREADERATLKRILDLDDLQDELAVRMPYRKMQWRFVYLFSSVAALSIPAGIVLELVGGWSGVAVIEMFLAMAGAATAWPDNSSINADRALELKIKKAQRRIGL